MRYKKGIVMLWMTRDRYYFVGVFTDLFGDKILTKYWGGIHSHLGGVRTIAVGDESIAHELSLIEKMRARKGYARSDGETSQRQQPTSDVAVKTSCMTNMPSSSRMSANAIQNTLEIRNKRNPQPENRELTARSRAPRTPKRVPLHSHIASIQTDPQLCLPFLAI
jgi:hypothetical protein